MKSDYWLPGNQVFVHYGQKWGVSPSLRTILIGPEKEEDFNTESVAEALSAHDLEETPDLLPVPAPNVTDNCENLPLCDICKSPIPGKREDRHLCSARCRKRASRKG